MKNKKLKQNRVQNLAQCLATINCKKVMGSFLQDLCTTTELEAMADRIWIIPLIQAGHSYRDIHKKTGVSVTTIGRVASHLRSGHGGYDHIFNNID